MTPSQTTEQPPFHNYKAGRALLGWMTPREAELTLAARVQDAVLGPESVAMATRTRDAVARREPGCEQGGILQEPPPELAGYLERLRQDPSARPYFAEGWSVRLVDLSRVCAMQPHVIIDNAKERVLAIVDGDMESVAAVTLPTGVPQPLPAQFDEVRKTWVFSSANPNLRIMGHFGGPSQQPGVGAFGFAVGVASSFVQVAMFRGRAILRDGYHRSVGLVARGVKLAPVFVRDFRSIEEFGVPGMLPQEAYLGDRPPTLSDYLNDEVAADCRLPSSTKMVVIQALELAAMS